MPGLMQVMERTPIVEHDERAGKQMVVNPFTRSPVSASLHGSMIFYIKRTRNPSPTTSSIHGIRRGPIYLKSNLTVFGASEIFATESSFVGVRHGEGFIQDAEIRIVPSEALGSAPCFVVKLKNKELYIVEKSGKLLVTKTTREKATRFVMECREGSKMVPMTTGGQRWYDNGDKGWNTLGKGDPLWVEFVTEEEKKERCQKNRWGHWQPEYDFEWR